MGSHALLSALTLLMALLPKPGHLSAANDNSQCARGHEGADCKFFDDLCRWDSIQWAVGTVHPEAQLDTNKFDTGSLRSTQLCSTRWATHCLTFDYAFWYQREPEVRLTVFLEVEGKGTTAVWSFRDMIEGFFQGAAPLQTTANFKIVFKVERPAWYHPGVGSFVKVTNIAYKDAPCSVRPPDARIRSGPALTAAPILGTSPPSATTLPPTRTTLGATPPGGSPAPRDPQTGSDAALIGGTVTAAVVVIALVVVIVVVVVVVVVVKKRRSKRKQNTVTMETVNRRLGTSPVHHVPPVPNDGDDGYEIPLAHAPRPVPAEDGTYVNMDNSHPQAHDPPSPARPTQETNTYDHPHTYENPTASELHIYESHTQEPNTHEILNPYEPCESPPHDPPTTHDPETYETVQ